MVVEDQNDLTKLIDFGLARVNVERLSTLTALDGARKSLEEGRVTGTGMIFGTIAYLAPEAALGMDSVDGRSDLYALGMMFYEMLAGKHPFDAVDPIELFKMQRMAKVPPLAERAPKVVVPPEIEAIAHKLLEKDPERRYPSGRAGRRAGSSARVDAGLEPLSSVRPTSMPAASELKSSARPPAGDEGPGSSTGAVVGDPAELQRWSPMTELSPKWQLPAPAPLPRRMAFGWIVGAAALVVGAALEIQLMRPSAPRTPATTARPEAMSVPVASVAPAPPPAPRETAQPASALPAIVVPPVASSASEKPAAGAPLDLDFDEPGAKVTMTRAAALHEWATSEKAFDALADKAPAAFADRQVALGARDLAVGLEKEGAGEKVFDRLARGLGTAGLDILYTIVESRGGSKAAARAADLLRETEVLKRATPELPHRLRAPRGAAIRRATSSNAPAKRATSAPWSC